MDRSFTIFIAVSVGVHAAVLIAGVSVTPPQQDVVRGRMSVAVVRQAPPAPPTEPAEPSPQPPPEQETAEEVPTPEPAEVPEVTEIPEPPPPPPPQPELAAPSQPLPQPPPMRVIDDPPPDPPQPTPEPVTQDVALALPRSAPAEQRPAPDPPQPPEPVEAPELPESDASEGAELITPATAMPRNRPPQYPARALQQGLEGTVTLELYVKPDGTVGDVRLIDSSGHRILDSAATRGVRSWRFEPARRLGRPIAHWHTVECRFTIEGR